MSHAHTGPQTAEIDPSEPKKLILCFDGTGNTFSGSNADTNVVKMLRKLDRNHPNQFHYYQTGIGTYDIGETSVNKGILGEISSSISKTMDSGFGTTFDAHVMAGYRFLMRYYETDGKIYMFGFSRGAFTAKFLARMVNKVGLLCKGNEEMVPFVFRMYQRYLAGEIQDRVDAQNKNDESQHQDVEVNGNVHGQTAALLQADAQVADPLLAGKAKVVQSDTTKNAHNEIDAFSQTFCRNERHDENIKVFFLGIWDCVNSVAVLERKAPVPVAVTGTACHVRHAVAVDERRVKFKPALLAQDIRAYKKKHAVEDYGDDSHQDEEDIKEVWFPGNHGDVGGGWPALDDNPLDQNKPGEMSCWQRIRNFWTSRKAIKASPSLGEDRLQMSDVPLEWMIREVELAGKYHPKAAVHWSASLKRFRDLMEAERQKEWKEQALNGFMHDCLSFGCGTAFFKVLMWKFMEYLPILTRWELNDTQSANQDKGWKSVTWPPNVGSARDIPRGAVLHKSLKERLENDPDYRPANNHGEALPPCLLKAKGSSGKGKAAEFKIHEDLGPNKVRLQIKEEDPNHQTYDFVPAKQ